MFCTNTKHQVLQSLTEFNGGFSNTKIPVQQEGKFKHVPSNFSTQTFSATKQNSRKQKPTQISRKVNSQHNHSQNGKFHQNGAIFKHQPPKCPIFQPKSQNKGYQDNHYEQKLRQSKRSNKTSIDWLWNSQSNSSWLKRENFTWTGAKWKFRNSYAQTYLKEKQGQLKSGDLET